MDRTQSSGPAPRTARRPWLALAIAAGALGPPAQAAGDGPAAPLWTDCLTALREAGQGGPPVVLLVTSTASPESQQLRWALEGYLASRPSPPVARFAEVPAEAQPALVQRLGVARYPTLLVYRKAAAGLELIAHREGPADARSVVAWLDGLGMLAAPAPAADGQLARADFHHGGQGALPSPQAPAPPPPAYYPQAAPPPAAPPAPQTIYVQAPPQPIAAAVPSAPVVVSPPSQAVVFQPQATNVMIGPTPPPNVTFVQGPSAPPNVALAVPAQAAPPPTYAMAAPAPAYAPYPMAAPAPQPQQSIVGTTAIALLLNNPGLIDSLLGAIGRHLSKRGQPRVEMAPSSPAAMLAPASAFAAPAALGATSIPLAQPVQPYLMAPQPEAAPPPPYPPGPYPSPQSPEPPHKGLFHRWGR